MKQLKWRGLNIIIYAYRNPEPGECTPFYAGASKVSSPLTVVDGDAVQAIAVFDFVRPAAARDGLAHVDGARRGVVVRLGFESSNGLSEVGLSEVIAGLLTLS
jgi:hypothetical protein